jgi:hypothetical protein
VWLVQESQWAKKVGNVTDIGGGGYPRDGKSLDGLQAEGFASALAFAGVCLIDKHQACRKPMLSNLAAIQHEDIRDRFRSSDT